MCVGGWVGASGIRLQRLLRAAGHLPSGALGFTANWQGGIKSAVFKPKKSPQLWGQGPGTQGRWRPCPRLSRAHPSRAGRAVAGLAAILQQQTVFPSQELLPLPASGCWSDSPSPAAPSPAQVLERQDGLGSGRHLTISETSLQDRGGPGPQGLCNNLYSQLQARGADRLYELWATIGETDLCESHGKSGRTGCWNLNAGLLTIDPEC